MLWVEIWLLVTLFLWCFVVSRLEEAFMRGLLASWFYDVVGGVARKATTPQTPAKLIPHHPASYYNHNTL